MDPRATNIINKMLSLTSQFGVPVTISRYPKTTPTTPQDAFGQSTNPTSPQQIVTNVIVESQKIDLTATLVGGKQVEILKLIANIGVFLSGDEFPFGGHTFKVNFTEPVNFTGSDVVEFIHASREVD